MILAIGNTAAGFLTDHANSMKVLIQKDIESAEEKQRKFDTRHYVEFCALWKISHRDFLNTESGNINSDAEMDKLLNRLPLASQQRNYVLVDSLNTQIESFEQQQAQANAKIQKIQELKACMRADIMPVLERLGNGRGFGTGDVEASQRRKLQQPRDEHLFKDIKDTCTKPALQPTWFPPKDPTKELERRVRIDTGRLVRLLEDDEAASAATAEEKRTALQTNLFGKAYLQIADGHADEDLTRGTSVPSQDAYGQTFHAQQARGVMRAQRHIPEGTPPQPEPEPEPEPEPTTKKKKWGF